jgi:predicted metal-dependent hydrolase
MMTEFPPEFWQGVEEFNRGEFYACHDTLESIWLESVDPEKTFYQGILQIAVAFYHLSNQNWKGCLMLLGEGTNRLRRYRPEYGQIDVESLFSQGLEMLQVLQDAGEEKTAEFARQYGLMDEVGTLALPKVNRVSS